MLHLSYFGLIIAERKTGVKLIANENFKHGFKKIRVLLPKMGENFDGVSEQAIL